MGIRRNRFMGLALAVAFAGTPVLAAAEAFDKERMEKIEDLTEAMVNDLLLLAIGIRERDDAVIGTYVAETVDAAPFPTTPDAAKPAVKWISTHGWLPAPGGAVQPVTKTKFLADLNAFLDHFSEIDDARFKAKLSDFDPADPTHGSAKVLFKVEGRDVKGHREYFQAMVKLKVENADGKNWRIRKFEPESFDSKVSGVDLFSEVGEAAGLSAPVANFGTGANRGFKYHGAAAADVNDDGLLDIAASGVERNYLYLNLGNGRFRDASQESLLGFAPAGTGVVFLDFDNDGDSDLFMANVGAQMLFENRWVPEKKVRFLDVSERQGVALAAIGFSVATADLNGDKVPDIYVSCYNRYGDVMPNSWEGATNGTPNLLFVSQPDGTYREQAKEWGVADPRWSYAAAFADADGDGDLDLHVANDYGDDGFYRNVGGRFQDVAAEVGLEDPGFGMGASWGDFDNDGDLDLHVTNMSSTAGNRILKRLYGDGAASKLLTRLAAGNSLFENRGNGTFEDVSQKAGGFSGNWAWGGGFVDFDNDGWEDLYTPNGFVSGDKSMKDT